MGQNITKMSASECADDLIVRDAEKFANLNKSKKEYQNGKYLSKFLVKVVCEHPLYIYLLFSFFSFLSRHVHFHNDWKELSYRRLLRL